MEIKNKLTVTRGEGEREVMVERRGTCTKDPWTMTMGRGWSLRAAVWQDRGEQQSENGENYN